jgi:feruloyl-CoA synthase
MDAATQWLMDQPRAGPVLILAGNTPAFAVMSFAAQASGRAACPVSVTYAALGGDYGRLAHVIAKVKPAVVFAEDSAMASGALQTLDLGGATIVTTDPSRLSKPATRLCRGLATVATPAVAESIAALKPHDRAALMLTSGSTGLPKVVPITFDNLAANSAQCQQTIGEAAGWHEAMLDWLPWHHAAGAFVLRPRCWRAARCTSTTASRRRACSRPRSRTCARSRSAISTTCRWATPCWSTPWRRTPCCGRPSSRRCG